MIKEIAWILGCCLITGTVIGIIAGVEYLEQSSNQQVTLFTIYFFFPTSIVMLFMFLLISAIIYLMRGISKGFTEFSANLILGLFSLAIIPFCVIGIGQINQLQQEEWVAGSQADEVTVVVSAMGNSTKPLLIYLGIFWFLVALFTLKKVIKEKIISIKHSG